MNVSWVKEDASMDWDVSDDLNVCVRVVGGVGLANALKESV